VVGKVMQVRATTEYSIVNLKLGK
ncbi:hypothetical protein LCGC14_2888810, partial [marine sediment metagenome]